jgi:hypothetical protein
MFKMTAVGADTSFSTSRQRLTDTIKIAHFHPDGFSGSKKPVTHFIYCVRGRLALSSYTKAFMQPHKRKSGGLNPEIVPVTF